MKTTTSLTLVLASLLIVTFFSCRKEDPVTYYPLGYNNSGTGKSVNTTICGRIVDESGQALQGVIADINNQTVITDNYGLFTFDKINVSEARFVVKLSKAGYLDQYYGGRPYADDVTFLKATLIAAEGTFTVAAAAGGTTTLSDGSTAIFPSNAFMNDDGTTYSGTVTVKMSYINNDDQNFNTKIPGNDLKAIDAGGEDKVLVSFGMMNVELLGAAGESLNLAPGKSAQLSFPISASQMTSAPTTMPLWYFDTSTGLWKEEGVATRNGNIYTGSVNHFSWWNVDLPYGLATVSGYVKSCDGIPLGNIDIYANGYLGYTTNSQGYYEGDAPAGFGSFGLQAYDGAGNSTQTVFVPNLTTGQVYNVPVLMFNTGSLLTITGTAADCDNSPASALITITSSQGNYWNYIYTNGPFSFTVPQGGTYTITATYSGLSGQVIVTASQTGLCENYDIGLLPICNLTNPGISNFSATLITSQFGNQALNYLVDQCSVTTDASIPQSIISMTSTDIATNFITDIEVSVSNYQQGNYTWNAVNNSISIIIMLNGSPVNIEVDLNSNGGNTINTASLPGGMIDASFSGPVLITGASIPGGEISGYISGSFSVFRNN